MNKGELIPIGKIIKLSGHSGELIISGSTFLKEFKDFSLPLFIELDGEEVPFYIEELKAINSEKAVVTFQYVQSEKKAERLIDKNILAPSSGKKKDKMKFDLAGFMVIDEIEGELGKIKFIDQNSKNPLMIIENGSNEIYIPFREEFILGIDKKENVLMVKCPPGLLDLYLKPDEEE